MFWSKLSAINTGVYQYMFFARGSSSSYNTFIREGSGAYYVQAKFNMAGYYATLSAVPTTEWTHFVMTWDHSQGTGVKVYVNGHLDTTLTGSSQAPSTTIPIAVGSSISGAYLHDGLIDDFAIVGRYMDEYEVMSIYHSNAPILAVGDIQTWVSPTGNAWLDEQGIFARDGSGNAVLGVATASVPWGGQSLLAGDVLIGNGTSYMKWDKTTGKLIVKGQVDADSGSLGALSVIGNLSVGTGGAISSGATAYDTGTGWWLDYNGGTPRLYVGNGANNYLKFDGNLLTWKAANSQLRYLREPDSF